MMLGVVEYQRRVRRRFPRVVGSGPDRQRRVEESHGGFDTGSIAAFAVLLLVAMVALLGLVVDGGKGMAAQQAAHAEAEQAARAGAGALSVDGLRSGQFVVDQQAAINAAVAYTVQAGHPGIAMVSNSTVTVNIRYSMSTDVLGLIGISSMQISVSASAVDLHGVTRED